MNFPFEFGEFRQVTLNLFTIDCQMLYRARIMNILHHDDGVEYFGLSINFSGFYLNDVPPFLLGLLGLINTEINILNIFIT